VIPLLPVTVIGSWSYPGWYAKFCGDVQSDPGLFGDEDKDEAIRDAVRLAVHDQLQAGADIITDGEMQRVDFNLSVYQQLQGVEPLAPRRLWGPPAHDQRSRYRCREPINAPQGLGFVEEFRRLRAITWAPAKVSLPGPYTLAGCLSGGEIYDSRREIAEALIPIVNAEMHHLVSEGADFLQLDEPSFACHPDHPEEFLDIVAATVDGVEAKIGMHLCFGNYRARAVGWRSYRPLFPHLAYASVKQLALEFASREMAEIDLLKEIPAPMEVAVGLVDVKNSWVEPVELVAERLRAVLQYIEPERVHITPDCGFSQTARFIAIRKLRNLVEGVRIVRHELGIE